MAKIVDQVFDYLKSQGLQPEMKPFGIYFMYQMKNFYILSDDEDELFFRVVMPGIMDVDANNRADVLEACNKITANIKIAKAFINDETKDIWLATEQLLDQDPRFDDIVPRSLRILMAAYMKFAEAINA